MRQIEVAFHHNKNKIQWKIIIFGHKRVLNYHRHGFFNEITAGSESLYCSEWQRVCSQDGKNKKHVNALWSWVEPIECQETSSLTSFLIIIMKRSNRRHMLCACVRLRMTASIRPQVIAIKLFLMEEENGWSWSLCIFNNFTMKWMKKR